ncbi:MAG TPA: polysaccharide biosynthesis/export family protein [Bryobacteraceae bacterium]|nr:polysaccharide biosynthesis/export family protein [Bryobacteraceae bacterium]
MRFRIIALLLGFVLCIQARDRDNYLIGPGDEISVRVLDSPDIPDKPIRVDPDGQIALPLIGRVEAAGKSVSTLESDITARLRRYFVSPQVSVNVTDFASRPVSVLGAVQNPGVYQLSGPKSLAEVIALAKGLSQDAGGKIRIVSNGEEPGGLARRPLNDATSIDSDHRIVTEVSIDDLYSSSSAAANTLIHGYDVITVPKARMVYVIGDVHKPGAHLLNNRDSITVLEAISMAEGPLPTAAPQHARLLRKEPNTSQRVEVPIDLKQLLAGHGENLTLQPDDILVVPSNTARAIALRSIEAAIQLGTGIAIWRH